ncbi:MurR/RpiR family transcriptional regulator [Neobacillus muris]|uniref:MurR/RpiR family transcriptional regulator n=1 Tax=Neobacillus muris TaxID=2941334 RepID=UPI00203F42BD|nr:MurR/RpiR family transcriptional regulator [Neobacillus muris]
MSKGGLLLIRECLSSVKPSERNAAQYIIDNPEKIIHLSVQQLAEASHSSEAAITRLCKNLGFNGFKDLKIRIAGDLPNAAAINPEYSEILPNDNIPTLMNSLAINTIASIKETFHSLDPKKIQEAVERLAAAARIDFYGVGASQLVAQDAQQKFSRIGKTCTAYTDVHLQLTSAANLSHNDVAVAISYTGETSQVISAIRQAKNAGAATIVISKYGKNQLSKISDLHLGIIAKESNIRSAATSSRIAQLYIIDVLYTGVAGTNYDSAVVRLEKSRKAIQDEFGHTR